MQSVQSVQCNSRSPRHLLLVSGQDAALWLLPLPPSLPPLTDDDRLLQCIGSITSGISDCLQLAVVRNRAATLKKKLTRYLYFETGFRFQKRFPLNRKSINSPSRDGEGYLRGLWIQSEFAL